MIIPQSATRSTKRSGRVAQLKHRLRWARQCIVPPQVAVVGGYHHGNLGDMALGHAVQRRVHAAGFTSGLQTIYNLERWPKAKAVIVGGGAVGYGDGLLRLRNVYGRDPKRVAILGVDFNDPAGVEANSAFLNQAAIITCRSVTQAVAMQKLLGRSDILSHPDLCFSLYDEMDATALRPPGVVLGINCVPLFLRQCGNRLVPGSDFMAEVQRDEPRMVAHVDRLGTLYSNLVRAICSKARELGMAVRHIPFTPEDDMFARTILPDGGVEFIPYTSDVVSVLSEVGRCTRFFTSRFHSLVFAMLKHCEIIPFCYASKCDRLLMDFQLKHPSIIRIQDLIDGRTGIAEAALGRPGIQVPTKIISAACRAVTARVDAVMAQMGRIAFE